MKLIPRGSGSWQEVTRALGYDKRHNAINYNGSTQPHRVCGYQERHAVVSHIQTCTKGNYRVFFCGKLRRIYIKSTAKSHIV